MRKLLVPGLLLIGALGGGRLFRANGGSQSPVEYRDVSVERGSIVYLVGATGTINSVTSVQIGA